MEAVRFGPADDPVARAATIATLGQRGRLSADDAAALSAAANDDPDPRVRGAALGALTRRGSPGRATDAWRAAAADADPAVRRRAGEMAPVLAARVATFDPTAALVHLVDDGDVTVVEAAAWALGELADGDGDVVPALARVATGHSDALAREAAVAALGARGDAVGLPALLAACGDVPTVRRRAVLALAPFHGDAVDAALAAARQDRDWQVRQAAEDLLDADHRP